MSQRRMFLVIVLTILAASLALVGSGIAGSDTSDSTQTAAPADTSAAQPPSEPSATPQAESQGTAVSSDSTTSEPAAKAETKEPVKKGKKAKKTTGKGSSKAMDASAKPGTMPVKPEVTPQHVQVQHILIGFSGSVPGKNITRTKDEAKKLAYQLLERARKGESFDELVRQYTDDSPPGIYGMSGNGVAPAQGEYPRGGMVPAFGNVGFAISPGNISIADYDAKASPFGWHIIKRLK